MSTRKRLLQLCHVVVVVVMLCNTTPTLYAQNNIPLFLPLLSNGAPTAQSALLFRTHIHIETQAQWRALQRMDLVILAQGDDWATVLVDDLQLADLARLRYTPDDTNALATMAAHDTTLQAAVAELLQQAADLGKQIVQGSDTTLAAARSELSAQLQQLEAMQLETITRAASVDSDNDGLTDDQEGFWCTNPNLANSDGLAPNDGQEVADLKAWATNNNPSNLRSGPPASGKPFAGWPVSPTTGPCIDGDQDAVPDLAEGLELGLNPERESTDLDKFDDGQELFGTTYCPGSGGFCGYGVRPRNEDWGTITAQMPSWVKAPGHHPLVAAFPVPEIDIVESSFHVQAVTTVTTDHMISSGTEKSYSTAKTEGTSTSVANTVNWNEWEEVSDARTQPVNASNLLNTSGNTKISNTVLNYNSSTSMNYSSTKVKYNITQNNNISQNNGGGTGATVSLFSDLLDLPSKAWNTGLAWGEGINEAIYLSSAYGAPWNWRDHLDEYDEMQLREQLAKCESGQTCRDPATGQLLLDGGPYAVQEQGGDITNQTLAAGGGGYQTNLVDGGAISYYQRPIEVTIKTPPTQTHTETKGKSWGGAETTTSEQYEEHTVTNSEAFSNGESWGNATAVDSAHAADLWFTYKVRNAGMEYAREIGNLTFNLYLGNNSAPAYTYFVAPDLGGNGKFINFMPNEEHAYTSRRIPLTLNQMKEIDLGGPIRIVAEDFSYGIDELFYQDAANAGILVSIEDGADDGDEMIDTYLIPTWTPEETVLQVVARYFPHETDDKGTITAIWTPEYRNDTPSWCQDWRRPTDYPTKAIWCKHTLSTADWWNVYTNGLGDGSEGFQDTQAVPGSVALFRFNKDMDLDGFSDRAEKQIGTAANDATSFPQPEVLAGVYNLRSDNRVTSTLSLLNSGIYDAYGVEAVIVAPDDSVSISNNIIGGSGRVRALKQVIVGSSLKLQSPLPAPWTQANHATIGVGGYYIGTQDRTYTFTVSDCPVGGCTVGSGTWKLAWNDGQGASGQLDLGANYKSPTFLPVGTLGLTLALYSGNVANGESFTVSARTPRDTFQYTINRTPYTEPLVIVSYNDPQGNHRFVLPSQAMSLTVPTTNLQQFAGTMLDDVGVEIVTSQPMTVGVNSATLLVNNPSDKTLQNAHLFLEVINITGTVVAETPVTVTLPPGPTATPITFNTNSFNPAYRPTDDYIVMAFLTDYQGNILDTAGRPLSSFQADPLPELAADDSTLTWHIGTVTQGTLLKHPLALANTGFGRLYTYIPPSSGLALNAAGSRTIGAADLPSYELTLRTATLPVGPYDQTLTLATSDPAHPTRTLRVYGTITAPSGDTSGGVLQRPLDFAVTVPGSHSQGEWVEFTHGLGPEPLQNLHPVKVYSQDYSTLYGVGKYATAFGQGTASYDMFGDGRDGVMPSSGNLDNDNGTGFGIVNSGSAEAMNITVTDAYAVARINPGDVVLIHQTQGTNAGCWELNKAVSDFAGNPTNNTYQLAKPLQCNYNSSGNSKAQIMRVPQYSTCNVTGTVTPLTAWNGDWAGIFAVMCNGSMHISGSINASGHGFRGGSGGVKGSTSGQIGNQGESVNGIGNRNWPANGAAGGGGEGDYWPNSGPIGKGGGGGSYQDIGGNGGHDRTNSVVAQSANGIGGTADLNTIFLGSGGGGGGADADVNAQSTAPSGGVGGGIAVVLAKELQVTGSILVNGNNGNNSGNWTGGGGGGGSGAVRIITSKFQSGANLIQATGGIGGRNTNEPNNGEMFGGNGGAGRIRIEYCESLIGTTNPPASTQKLNCYITEQVETAPYNTARLNLPETFSNGRTYNVQFGHKLAFNASGEQPAILRVPAGLVANSSLDVLLNNAGTGDLTLKLDIGNNGSWDWETTQNVTNAATFSSPDLSAAFNQYWSSHGSPTTGKVEIPVKLWLSKAATTFITNLQQLNLTASGVGSALDPKPLDVTVAITGSHTAGEWVQFTHNIGLELQSLQPVKVYNQGYNSLLGVGKYATIAGQGTVSQDTFGDGRDGNLVVSFDTVFSPHDANISGVAGGTTLALSNKSTGFVANPGDTVFIHQTRGVGAGRYQRNTVLSYNDNTLILKTPLTFSPTHASSHSDPNKAQAIIVPQYINVSVSSGKRYMVKPWDGFKGGILVLQAHNLMVDGLLDCSGGDDSEPQTSTGQGRGGFRGGRGGNGGSDWGTIDGSNTNPNGEQGESYLGLGGVTSSSFNGGGGGGGVIANSVGGNGGGGSYGGYGYNGDNNVSFTPASGGTRGDTYGSPDMTVILFGSGGGGGAASTKAGGEGGGGIASQRGGGIFVGYASDIIVNNAIRCKGGDVWQGLNNGNIGTGGGGSGGSILLVGRTVAIGANRINVAGGRGGANNSGTRGGDGGDGRIRIEYCESLTGTTNPLASTQKLNCYIAEQIETTPYNTARLNLPESFSDGRTYKVQFGRKLDFAAAGNQVTTLRVPAGLYNSVQLDALVSGLPANATLSLDVGNDGSTEWNSAVANNSTNPSADLAAAFTAYWRSQNSPSGGTLDVPIKVTTTQPGQVLLTNLQVSATGSRLRHVRVPVATYTNFLLDFTAGSGGTVALDLGDDGSIDWSTPLDAPRQLTKNLKDTLNSYLAGKSGEVDVPVRFYLAPLHPITLNDYQATTASTLDLTPTSITVGGSAVTAASTDSLLINGGDTATVQATLRNTSNAASGPLTAAFFATAAGWGDWYIGSAFVATIPAMSNTQVSIPWNTTGFSGTVPVKVVINPYRRVAETNYTNNSKTTSVIINPPLVLPAAPTSLVATADSATLINLSWTDASSNESGFKLERSPDGSGWTPLATVGTGVTTYANSGLACGRNYAYRVRATHANGDSAFSNVAVGATKPCRPALQPITGITPTTLTLLWTDNNQNETGFRIDRAGNGGSWTQLATVGANVTTYTDSGLTCGTAYAYRVRANNSSGASTYSPTVNATTTVCAPAAPTLLAATAISATQISLSWQDNSSTESGFKVERSPDGVTGWVLLTTLGANGTSYADSGLACATPYHYRVRATNAGGDSATSNIATATTPACLPDLLFADGFESGTLNAWSSRSIGGGDLRVSPAAALVGSQGMSALLNDNVAMSVTDDSPNAEPRYRARFYLDPNTIAMADREAHYLFYGYQGTTTIVLRLELRRSNNRYQLRTATLTDVPTTGNATWKTTGYVTLSDAPHFVELDWQAATAPGANNGSLTFWLDGVQKDQLTALDNDTRRLDRARLGPVGGLDTGTRGTYYFDAFESRRRTYIGPIAGSALAADATTPEELMTTMVATTTLHTLASTPLTAEVGGLGVQLAFPALTTTAPLTVALLVTDTQTLPDGYTLLGEMMAVGTNAPFTQPVTVQINYSALSATLEPTSTLTLQRWNGDTEQWEALPAQVNADTQTLTATIDTTVPLALWQENLAETEESVDQVEETAVPVEQSQESEKEYSIYLPIVQE